MSYKMKIKNTERIKGAHSVNIRFEKGNVVWSDMSGLSQLYPNSCIFSFLSSCFVTFISTIGSPSNGYRQYVKNEEVAKQI